MTLERLRAAWSTSCISENDAHHPACCLAKDSERQMAAHRNSTNHGVIDTSLVELRQHVRPRRVASPYYQSSFSKRMRWVSATCLISSIDDGLPQVRITERDESNLFTNSLLEMWPGSAGATAVASVALARDRFIPLAIAAATFSSSFAGMPNMCRSRLFARPRPSR